MGIDFFIVEGEFIKEWYQIDVFGFYVKIFYGFYMVIFMEN